MKGCQSQVLNAELFVFQEYALSLCQISKSLLCGSIHKKCHLSVQKLQWVMLFVLLGMLKDISESLLTLLSYIHEGSKLWP